MTIREATIDDLPQIVSIYNESIPGRLSTADVELQTVADKTDWFLSFAKDNRPFWVCIDDAGDVIGWICLKSFYGRCAYRGTVEVSTYISYPYHRMGVARTLMQYALSNAALWGIDNITAFVFSQNVGSIKLFQNFGFEKWGHLPGIAKLNEKRCNLEIWGLALLFNKKAHLINK